LFKYSTLIMKYKGTGGEYGGGKRGAKGVDGET
jgi:hypothetical protein